METLRKMTALLKGFPALLDTFRTLFTVDEVMASSLVSDHKATHGLMAALLPISVSLYTMRMHLHCLCVFVGLFGHSDAIVIIGRIRL